jgi:uncharacterized protein YpmS
MEPKEERPKMEKWKKMVLGVLALSVAIDIVCVIVACVVSL